VAEDTAVLDAPETSDGIPAAPVEELETEQEGLDTEETDEDNAETTEAGLTEEEVQRRVNEAVAAQRAEFDAEQNTKRYKANVEWAESQLKTRAVSSLDEFTEWYASEIETKGTRPKINRQVIDSLAGNLANAAALDQWQAISDDFTTHVRRVYPEWRPSVEMQRSLEQTLALPREHPERLSRMFTLRWEFMRQAIKESEVPKEAKKVAAEIAAKNKKAGTVEQTLAGDKARANAERPTTTSGPASAQSITNFHEASVAYNAGRITGLQYGELAKKFNVRLD
jgi:hypothetical protein